MPIKGWSDQFRPPMVGTIHIGEKEARKGKEYPKALDYFRFPEDAKHPFGERPQEIEIYFPVDDIEWCCSAHYKEWGGSKDPKKADLICKGDGETAARKDLKTGRTEEIECLGPECPRFIAEKCVPQVWIKCIVPQATGLGYYQIYSKSYNSYVNIHSALLMFAGRSFKGIPFKLRVKMKSKIVEGTDGKSMRKTFPVLYMVQNEISFAELGTVKRHAIPAGESVPDIREERPDHLIPVKNRSGDNSGHDEPIDSEAVEAAEEETAKKAEEAEAKVEAGKKNGVADLF